MKITLPKIKVPATLMAQIGIKIKNWIREDNLKGLGQDDNSLGNYRSAQYMRYKKNFMNRFTDKQGNKGTKLKAVQGQSVVSNEISFVNMTLTGQMIRGLQGKGVKENEITMAYLPKDAGKIIGNRALGREVVGLNSKNQDLVKEEIVKYLNTIIEGWAKEDIIIQIG